MEDYVIANYTTLYKFKCWTLDIEDNTECQTRQIFAQQPTNESTVKSLRTVDMLLNFLHTARSTLCIQFVQIDTIEQNMIAIVEMKQIYPSKRRNRGRYLIFSIMIKWLQLLKAEAPHVIFGKTGKMSITRNTHNRAITWNIYI